MQFTITQRAKSFVYAIRGLGALIQTQHNARIHLFATVGVISCGFLFDVSKTDWLFLVIAITMVWTAEAINTAIEFLADAVTEEHHPRIEKAKDIAAGAVLAASIGAAIIGVVVFNAYITSSLDRIPAQRPAQQSSEKIEGLEM